ncbi:leucine-rich colipase-like protein 1 isoform X1 [Monodelphis domestica]|uniref:leucine-rich colipase-like protein 1 isoform X1 n=1 Tax=Monodelphis domestica TaxID=13616 RepID=UPI0024E2677E|nr:leucine-rich colipase-like protein 1 isoform X1 [Monodelphis domestica]
MGERSCPRQPRPLLTSPAPTLPTGRLPPSLPACLARPRPPPRAPLLRARLTARGDTRLTLPDGPLSLSRRAQAPGIDAEQPVSSERRGKRPAEPRGATPAEGRAREGVWDRPQPALWPWQKSGEPCKTNTDCHSECCVLNTSVQKICRRRTFFRQCNSWQKSLGYNCKDSSECFSNCCTYTSNNHQKICAPRTIFLQCLSWKKEEGEVCSSHEECISDCCLRREEDEVFQCTEKTGLFIKCLLLPAKTYENEKDIFQRNIRGNWRKRMKAAPVTQPVTLAATGRGESN